MSFPLFPVPQNAVASRMCRLITPLSATRSPSSSRNRRRPSGGSTSEPVTAATLAGQVSATPAQAREHRAAERRRGTVTARRLTDAAHTTPAPRPPPPPRRCAALLRLTQPPRREASTLSHLLSPVGRPLTGCASSTRGSAASPSAAATVWVRRGTRGTERGPWRRRPPGAARRRPPNSDRRRPATAAAPGDERRRAARRWRPPPPLRAYQRRVGRGVQMTECNRDGRDIGGLTGRGCVMRAHAASYAETRVVRLQVFFFLLLARMGLVSTLRKFSRSHGADNSNGYDGRLRVQTTKRYRRALPPTRLYDRLRQPSAPTSATAGHGQLPDLQHNQTRCV